MESSQLKIAQINSIPSQAFNIIEKSFQSEKIVPKDRKGSGSFFQEYKTGYQNNPQGQKQVRQSEDIRSIKFWKIALLLISLAEFSIKISVIVVQYISSKIRVGFFCILVSITLFLTTLVFLSLKILSIRKIKELKDSLLVNGIGHPITTGPSQSLSPTLPKLKNEVQMMHNQKTSKVLSAYINGEKEKDQTFKNLQKIQRQREKSQSNYQPSGVSLDTNLEIIVASKIIENSVSIMGCIYLFCTGENPLQFGFRQVQFLLIITLGLTIFSSACLVFLYLKIKQIMTLLKEDRRQLSSNPKIPEQYHLKQPKPTKIKLSTALSIDNNIPSSVVYQNKQQKQCDNNDPILKLRENDQMSKPYLNQITQQVLLSPPVSKKNFYQSEQQIKAECLNTQLRLLKKPTIKKLNRESPRLQQNGSEANIQKRKVEINQKKIQYFQYASINPANNEMHSEARINRYSILICQKPKLDNQRIRNFLAKQNQEELLLQRQRELNMNRALYKSAKLAREISKKQNTRLQLPKLAYP